MAKRRTRKANKVQSKVVAPVVETVVVQESVAIREFDSFEKTVISMANFFENVAKYFQMVLTKKVS